MASASAKVGFGRYRFDPSSGRLWAGKREVRLTPKAAGVLALLVSHAGEPVTRQEMHAAVWGATVVSDDTLTSCVQEIRRALEDDARRPRFIETRHRRGYRFVAHVSPVPPAHAGVAPRTRARRLASIAVLPFADMSPSRDQDHVCEGLADELINALTHLDGLRVAARSSSFQFRGQAADVRAVGRELGVATVLEGSVRRAGDRLRVTVQLVDVADGCHRWSQRFDHGADDLLAVQDEIAESVATSMRGELSQRERKALRRPGTALEPYECFLRGRQHLHRMTKPDLARSRDMFERAIALDAGYAPAWAGLAAAHAVLHEWFGAKDQDLRGAGRASQRALELAPDLAEAHVARGQSLSLSRRYL